MARLVESNEIAVWQRSGNNSAPKPEPLKRPGEAERREAAAAARHKVWLATKQSEGD